MIKFIQHYSKQLSSIQKHHPEYLKLFSHPIIINNQISWRATTVKTPEIYLEPKQRVEKIIELLEKQYPNAKTALNFTNPLEILLATMLSAQTTDVTVNIVTKNLFKKYRTAEDYANADIEELEQVIHSTGFYHNKAKNLQKCCQLLVEKFHSQVPKTMEELLELPGVARKTANIVLYNALWNNCRHSS